MIDLVLLSLPVFGMVGLGWLAIRTRLAAPGVLDALTTFAFQYALPALVFRLIAGQPLGSTFGPGFYVGYLASGGLVFVAAFLAARLSGSRTAAGAAAHATTSTVGNLGFLGPPLMLVFLGERSAGPLAMAILAEVMVLMSLGAVLMGGSGDRRVLVRAALNPLVVAIVLGAVAAATGLTVPVPADQFLALLGDAAAPTALFALGGTLAVQHIDRATAAAAARMTAAKLVVYPLVVWCILALLLRAEAFWVQAGVLLAALPSATSTFILAQHHAADPEPVSAAIIVSTAAGVLTVPATAWLVLR